MIVGDQLRLWLDDRARQRAVHAARDRFAFAWDRGEVRRRFAAAFAAPGEPSAEAVAAAARTLFADDQWVDELIAGLADAARRDQWFEPPFRTLSSEIHNGLLVFEDENVTIAAGIIRLGDLAAKKNVRRGAVSINCTGQMTVLKFVKAGGATLSFWRAPPIGADFAAADAGSCRRARTRRIADGEIIVVDGRFEGFAIDHATANLVVLQAAIKRDQAPLSVEYDARSHLYVGCSAADDSDSRIQMLATLIRKMERDDAFPAVAAFLDHPSFFVRWHVMRELLGLDAFGALPDLRRMAAADPHPEVRQVAASVLAQIDPEEPMPCPA